MDVETIESAPEYSEGYEEAEVDELEDEDQPVIDLSEDEYQDSESAEALGASDSEVESTPQLTLAASIKNLARVGRAEVNAAKEATRALAQSQSTVGVGKRKQTVGAAAP